MALFCRALMAQKAFIEVLESLVITLKNGGLIKSENYNPGVSGFQIKHDGDAEFNDGIFRGTLSAREMRITGTVSSGTQYLLKASSMPAEVRAEAGWIAYGFEGLLKEIRTLAKGTCLLRMKFPRVTPARIGDINNGNIKITINDTILPGYSWYSINTTAGDVTLDVPNIPLNNDINTVRLYGSPAVFGNAAPTQSVINTLFELRCSQDPGFLGAFG